MNTKLALTTGVIALFTLGTSLLTPAQECKDIACIQQLEEAYFAKNGTYFQVLPNNVSAPYQKTDVKSALGKFIPTALTVDVYEDPDKTKGYIIHFTDAQGNYISVDSKGADTFERPAFVSATST